MKLASFHAGGQDRVGVSFDGLTLIGLDGPRSLLELIESGHQIRPGAETYSAQDVTWQAPVRRPSKICCLALNNSANSDRIMQGPKHPAMFIKPSSALVGHGGSIECQPRYGRVHPEPELAVVIGKAARNIAARDAYDYVFGYTVHNDITSPTMRTGTHFTTARFTPRTATLRPSNMWTPG